MSHSGFNSFVISLYPQTTLMSYESKSSSRDRHRASSPTESASSSSPSTLPAARWRRRDRHRAQEHIQEISIPCARCQYPNSVQLRVAGTVGSGRSTRHSPVPTPPMTPVHQPAQGHIDAPNIQTLSTIRNAPAEIVPNFLVVGGTGVGKSSFIRLLSDRSGRQAKVGNDLQSCTAKCEIYPCSMVGGRRYNLIDSPGFDDSRMSDAEVLTKLAEFLLDLYARRSAIHGVIFIHRINDTRLTGSVIRTAQVLRRMCGENFMDGMALVTSMWDLVESKEIAIKRESELLHHPQFWKEMRPAGLTKFRLSGTVESARKVIDWFLGPNSTFVQQPPKLKICSQIKEGGMLVSETDAGIFVMGELSKQRQRHVEALRNLRQEISQARKAQDGGAVMVYTQIQAREESSIRQNDIMQRKMMKLTVSPRTSVCG